jgi:uncharacterized protein (TIGR00255 family)
MTGYGRQEGTMDGRHIQVEIKSVNHRFLELSTHINRGYSFLEGKISDYIKSYISRGKVDIFVSVEPEADANEQVTVSVNHNIADSYIHALRELCNTYDLKDDLSVSTVARFGDIFTVCREPEDEETVWAAVKPIADEAMSSFLHMRITEGQKMSEDISTRANHILEMVEEIERHSPETVEAYRKRLYARLQEVLKDKVVDDQRVLTETAIFADKIAVDEETVRLRSHIAQFHNMLDSSEPVGRKLDFLVQEMNREANTIGSKCSDTQIAYTVVNMKAEIEKIREQIQNIE